MTECPICLEQPVQRIYFSCKSHWACSYCYGKCHVEGRKNLLRCPLCRAQHQIKIRPVDPPPDPPDPSDPADTPPDSTGELLTGLAAVLAFTAFPMFVFFIWYVRWLGK